MRRKTHNRRTRRTVTRRRKSSILPKIKITKEQKKDLVAVFMMIFSLFSLLAIYDQLGYLGDGFVYFLKLAFGLGYTFVPIFFVALSVLFFINKNFTISSVRNIGIFLLIGGVLGIINIFNLHPDDTFEYMKEGGGLIGASFSGLIRFYIGDFGSIILLTGLALIGFSFIFNFSFFDFVRKVFGLFSLFYVEEKDKAIKPTTKKESIKEKLNKVKNKIVAEDQKSLSKKLEIVAPNTNIKNKNNELPKKVESEQRPLISEIEEWDFPELSLLNSEKSEFFADEKSLNKKAKLIKQKLSEFGIGTELGPVHVGPTVTQFTLRPDEGVKLNKITTLKNDLTLSLAVTNLRIEAPIPGKDLVGIEIPNEKRTTVHLREILESEEMVNIPSSLRLAFGRDVSGKSVAFDLAEMPHLLIAGATGAGKSIGMNTFLMSLLYQNSPADLKMILIDPKRVELAPYEGIPHLLTPVITEADKALSALKWSVSEMMRRYGEMAKKGYRNIAEYNEKEEEKMPKIVVIIDELADLMMRQFKKDTESAICRLAQMARAIGMHLIIATQRPSVDVITGLIKANIPTRVSFAVTSSVDSRTVLDSIGAEDLLGKGDMLFSNSSLGKPKRIQGVYVSIEEINRVIAKIKMNGSLNTTDVLSEENPLPTDQGDSFSANFHAGDDINEQALEVIRTTGKASASLLQRRLSIGYARAARILDELEEQGYIGPSRGAKPREIFI